MGSGQAVRLADGAFGHGEALGQLIPGQLEYDPSLVDEYDVVCYLFQVGGDVAGQQNAVFFFQNEFLEQVQNFTAHHRVQAAGGFVQHQ